MSARPMDVAMDRPVTFPDTGLGDGWEPTALLTATLLLISFGLVNLYSASAVLAQRQNLPDYYYVLRQAAGAAAGLGVLVACVRIPYGWWKTFAWPLLGATWLLLVLVVVPWTTGIAPEVNGARRWVRLAGVTFQPSELAKIVLIVWTAALAVRKQEFFRSLSKGLVPFLVVWTLLLIPVLLQPDFSTAFVIAFLAVTTVVVAGARVSHFVFLSIPLVPVVLLQLGVGFRLQRILAFRNPEEFASGAGYQVQQSLIAIGSGGLTGAGFGEGRQKFGFLPEPHNDFIFSMIGEEWGLIGVLALAALYLTLILVGFRIARHAPDLFGQLLAIGCTNLIAVHAILHMSVGLGLLPSTGLSLPLVSYGRSNLIVNLIAIGMLMSVARGTRRWKTGEMVDA
ncbi:MAG: putative peptidoglycan glycosyltransferase FtsW [Gemmatimonadota bacterium]